MKVKLSEFSIKSILLKTIVMILTITVVYTLAKNNGAYMFHYLYRNSETYKQIHKDDNPTLEEKDYPKQEDDFSVDEYHDTTDEGGDEDVDTDSR